MKMMMSLAVAFALTVGASVFAETIVCNRVPAKKGEKVSAKERLEIKVAADKYITTIEDAITGDASLKEKRDKPLKPKVKGNFLVYKMFYQNEGDGDYPGPKTDIYIKLPKSLSGHGVMIEVYDKGDSGKDVFALECK